MIEYRAFRNTDTPQLAEIWRGYAQVRGVTRPMSIARLERYVLSKPTFDPQGLIVADDDGQLLGFAHAGFGPSDDRQTLSRACGVISAVMLRPEVDAAIGGELAARAEAYLQSAGARAIYGGGSYPLSPFYYGLYGGSELSGVLESDERTQAIFRDAGYEPQKRTIILQRELAGFRPVVDRQQIQIRRTTRIETRIDPPANNWWDAVMFEPFERTRWSLVDRDGPEIASVYTWNLETMLGAWGVQAVGIVDLVVPSERRRRGLATHLLGEAFRQLHGQGVSLAETHVHEQNAAGLAVFRHLGFEPVDASILYRKP